jgi:hypothetical protein
LTGGTVPPPVVEPLSAVVLAGFFFLSFLDFFAESFGGALSLLGGAEACCVDVVLVDWSLHPTPITGTTAIAAIATRDKNLRTHLICTILFNNRR